LIRLQFKYTNNTTEYIAYIIGLKVILKLKVEKLDVYRNSLLIICQVNGEWQIKDEKLKSYQDYLLMLANEFEDIKFTHMSRDKNQFANVLATLASLTQINIGSRIQPINIEIRNLQAHCYSLKESSNGKPWYNDIKRLIQHLEYPPRAFKMDEKTLKGMAMDYYLDRDVFYKRSFYGTLLRCLNEKKVVKAL